MFRRDFLKRLTGTAALSGLPVLSGSASAVAEVGVVQLRWTTWNEVCDFLGGIVSKDNPGRAVETFSDACGEFRPYIELTIPTPNGLRVVKHGDWIIRDEKGHLNSLPPHSKPV